MEAPCVSVSVLAGVVARDPVIDPGTDPQASGQTGVPPPGAILREHVHDEADAAEEKPQPREPVRPGCAGGITLRVWVSVATSASSATVRAEGARPSAS